MGTVGGAASCFAAVVGGAAVVFEGGPVTPDDAATVIAYFTDNRGAILAQSMLFLLGGAIYLWFIGSLHSLLLRAEGGSGRASAVSFAAASPGSRSWWPGPFRWAWPWHRRPARHRL